MRILEERGYTVDDILDQIKSELGFTSTNAGVNKYKFKLGSGIDLTIQLDDNYLIESSVIKLDSPTIDLVKESEKADSILAGFESASSIMDLFTRLNGEDNEDN